MLKNIKNQFAAELKKQGITAEVTFCRTDMFSILVDDAEQFEIAKSIISRVPGVSFDGEDRDDECGNVAFYRF